MHRSRRSRPRAVTEPTRKLVRELLNSLEDTAEAMAVIRTLLLLTLRERREEERLRMIQQHLRRLVPFDRFTLLRLRPGGRSDILAAFDGHDWTRGGSASWRGSAPSVLHKGKIQVRGRIPVRSLPVRPLRPPTSDHVGDATIPLGPDRRGMRVLHLACYEPDRILPEHCDILDQVQPALSVALAKVS